VKHAVVTLAHPDHAGMLRALKVLLEAGPRHGWELTLVFPEFTPVASAVGLPPDRILYLPGLRGWRRWGALALLPRTVASLVRLARDADLLYACTLSSFPPTYLAGRVARRPQVVHVYSSYEDGAAYRKHWLGRARHVIAPSADSLGLAERALGHFAPETRRHVVYNGMDVEWIERQAARPVPSSLPPPAGPRIGMVGNLDARKDPALLVQAAAEVRASVPALEVVLVGAFRDPRYEADVRALIGQRGLAGCVHVTGFLANPFPVVRTLDVLAHPARRDPFPLALLEGMALRRPIVASAVGGIPEMLDRESGVLVPPQDPHALAEALVRLIFEPETRTRLGDAAYARLTTRFSLEGFAASMFAAFDEALADGAR
jgi:glycosyltransferase involved in cell wall biosynthesis